MDYTSATHNLAYLLDRYRSKYFDIEDLLSLTTLHCKRYSFYSVWPRRDWIRSLIFSYRGAFGLLFWRNRLSYSLSNSFQVVFHLPLLLVNAGTQATQVKNERFIIYFFKKMIKKSLQNHLLHLRHLRNYFSTSHRLSFRPYFWPFLFQFSVPV